MTDILDCKNHRRFGVEVEVNTPNGVIQRPDHRLRQVSVGSERVALIVQNVVHDKVSICAHHLTYNNNEWIIKPDNSCGIEINSPVLKGWVGLKKLMQVVESLSKNYPRPDNRCSLHVHVNIADLSLEQLASVVVYYIKCEHIFFDAVPSDRKNNRYCQFIGMTDLFNHNSPLIPEELIGRLSGAKYTSFNTHHFVKGGAFSDLNERKKTIEFRIMGNDGCYDPFIVKNWVRLLLHFVDITKDMPLPMPFEKGNSLSGLLWLDPRDVLFRVMRFNEELSPGLRQVYHWFLSRILRHGYDSGLSGIWSNEGRKACREEFLDLLKMPKIDGFGEEITEDELYGEKYIF